MWLWAEHLVRRTAATLVAAAVVVGSAGPTAAQQADTSPQVVVPPATATAQLPPVAQPVVRIAAPPGPDVDPATITVEVVGITLGDAVRDDLLAAIDESRYDVPTESIVITIDGDAFAATGTYTLTAIISAADSDRQRLAIALVRPPGALEAPASVEVAYRDRGDDDTPIVNVRTGTQTRLTGLTIDPASPEAEGQLTFTVPAMPVGPSAGLVLDYEADDLPLGTVTRTYLLRDPQLASPVSVVFELTRRRSLWALGLFLAAGLILGLIIRRLLVWLKELTAARESLGLLEGSIDAERRAREDDDFQTAAGTLLTRLRAVRGNWFAWRRPQRITETVKSAQDELRTALDGLKTRRAARAAALTIYRDIAATGWVLPSPVEAPLDALRATVASASTALERDHLQAVDQRLGELAGHDSALRSAVLGWAQATRSALGPLTTLSADPSAVWRGARDLGVSSEAILAPLVASPPASLVDALRSVDQAQQRLEAVRRQVPWLVGQGGATLDVVGRLPEHPPADLAAARSHLATLADAADGPIDAVLDTYVAATQSVGRTLTRTAAARGRTAEAALLITSGNWAAAADTIAAARVTPAEGEGAELGERGAVEQPRAGAPAEAPGALVVTLRELVPAAEVPGRPLPSPVQVVAGARRLALGAAVVQFAVVLVLTFLVGFGLFQADWVGTYDDIVKVVAWGFTVDLGVAALIDLAQGRGGQRPAPPA